MASKLDPVWVRDIDNAVAAMRGGDEAARVAAGKWLAKTWRAYERKRKSEPSLPEFRGLGKLGKVGVMLLTALAVAVVAVIFPIPGCMPVVMVVAVVVIVIASVAKSTGGSSYGSCPDCDYDVRSMPPDVPVEFTEGVHIGPAKCPECGGSWPMLPRAKNVRLLREIRTSR